MFEIFQYQYATRAILAASAVGITCGLLGCFVVLRRMAMIGDALSHAILPGVVVGFILFGYNPLAIFGGALIAGLLTSAIITWIQQNSIIKDDASVGIVFTAMFALGIIGISIVTKNEGVHLDMKDFLFGNVLGVSDLDLWLTGAISLYVVTSIMLLYKYFFATTFDPLIALSMGISVSVVHYFLMFLLSLSIVASIQSVGVILVVAMLIIPASTAYLLTTRLTYMLVLSALLGLTSASLGFMLSVYFEITPGPTMTLLAFLFFLLALLFAPRKGLIFRQVMRWRIHLQVGREDLLKIIFKLSKAGKAAYLDVMAESRGMPSLQFRYLLYTLQWKGYLRRSNQQLTLTTRGLQRAERLVRAHRMWESYLVQKLNFSSDQIHESAERLEHVLTDAIVDKLDKELGYPAQDPHGSPIPKVKKRKGKMASMSAHERAIISDEQNDGIKELWHLGIFPNTEFVMHEQTDAEVQIIINNIIFALPTRIAKKINVEF